MLTYITTTTIHPGQAEAYETLLKNVARASEAQEPGCLSFKVCRVRGEPCRYLVVEQYVDEAALAAHRQAAYFKAAMIQLTHFLAAPPQMVVAEEL